MNNGLKNIVNFGIYGKKPLNKVRDISTIREMFETSTAMYRDRTAFMQKRKSGELYIKITYQEFYDDVCAFATGLIDMGLKDSKIAVMSENRYEWSVAYMAIVCGVGTVVPIDRELPFEEVKYLLDFSEASAIVCSLGMIKKKPEILDTGILCITMDDGENTKMQDIILRGRELLASGDTRFADERVNPDDADILIFTSGTTGNAKGVMLSHRNICSNMRNACSVFKITEYDRLFSLLPLHHTYECTCGFLSIIYAGASIAYCTSLKNMVKNMQETKPTMFFCVPLVLESIYRLLNKSLAKKGKIKTVEKGIALSKVLLKVGIDIRRKIFSEIIENFGGNLKMFMVGAAHIEPEILQFFTDIGITSIQGYGMTECSPLIAANRECYFDNESAGIVLPEVSVNISKPDSEGIGEIIVKGENVMLGYYKNPEETEKVLKDGWLYTGDMGYIKNGFIYITGRAKNVIITSNGKNVFPEEIENYLHRLPYVSESMVYESENDGKGIITAQIYPDFEAVEEKLGKDYKKEELRALFEEEIKAINKQIPSYKAISKFIIRNEEFIKTTTQKIKRSANI